MLMFKIAHRRFGAAEINIVDQSKFLGVIISIISNGTNTLKSNTVKLRKASVFSAKSDMMRNLLPLKHVQTSYHTPVEP